MQVKRDLLEIPKAPFVILRQSYSPGFHPALMARRLFGSAEHRKNAVLVIAIYILEASSL